MGETNRLPNSVAPATDPDPVLRAQLLDRRRRLTSPGLADRPGVRALIRRVDAALDRLAADTYGQCERCHGSIEPERLLADPLTRVCLDCLAPHQRRALERDLELASSIQTALLPSADLAIGDYRIHYDYRPLGAVSGDHCDVMPPAGPAGPWHFVLGDVSGKGVAASLLMSHLHAVFRSLVPRRMRLEEMMRHANRLFTAATLPASYATLVVGRLYPDGRLELCTAGHCPALCVRAGEVLTLPNSGLPLGFFASAEYETHRLRLDPGDLLFLYTDGLSESRSRSGEQYGASRIGQVLSRDESRDPRGLVRACLADLDAFRGGTPIDDDMTLLAICRSDPEG